MKTFLFGLLFTALGIGIGYWYFVMPHNTTPETAEVVPSESETTQVESLDTEMSANATTSGDAADEGVSITPDVLNDDQKQLLEKFGVDTENLIITDEMVRCAEEKVGAARLEEIKNGDTPSFVESLSLFGCYQ